MKDLRNPLTRTENFEHPSGNIMKELTEAELNSVAAGAGVQCGQPNVNLRQVPAQVND